VSAGGIPRPPKTAALLTLVARFYERLADHAVNVARRVVYLAGSAPRSPDAQPASFA
jgi:phosphate uptake regulator